MYVLEGSWIAHHAAFALLNAVVVDHSTILNNFKPHSCRTMVEVMVNVVAISSQVRMKIFYFFSDATSHGVRWVLH